MDEPSADFLQEVSFLADLTLDELRCIQPYFAIKEVDRHNILFMEDDLGDEFFIVKEGVVKIYRFADTREVILDIFERGDYFGEMSMIRENQPCSVTAKAIEPAKLYVLKRDVFTQLLREKPELTYKLLESTLTRLRRSNDLIKDLTTLNARSRIIQTLLRLAKKHGVRTGTGVRIDLRLTHQQLADMTSTVRETVTKTLLYLQQLKLIEVKQRCVFIIDVDALAEQIQ